MDDSRTEVTYGLEPAAIYISLLASILEIEITEAIVVGLLTFLAKFILAAAILAAI